jgi:hypothetical protein
MQAAMLSFCNKRRQIDATPVGVAEGRSLALKADLV